MRLSPLNRSCNVSQIFRSFAYHRDCPDGKIFYDEAEYNHALNVEGWVESPALIVEGEIADGWKEHPELMQDINPDHPPDEPKKRGRPAKWQRQEQPET